VVRKHTPSRWILAALAAVLVAVQLVGHSPTPALASGDQLDPNFGFYGGGGTGKYNPHLPGSRMKAYAVGRQKSGRLIVAGTINPPDSTVNDMCIIGLQADGQLDTAFGNDGYSGAGIFISSPQTGNSFDQPNALAIDKQDRIVLAGFTRIPGASYFALARFKADGSGLDPNFGNNGKTSVNFGKTLMGVNSQDHINAILIQSDGKIIVAGSSDYLSPGMQQYAFARFLPNGAPDPSWGNGTGLYKHLGFFPSELFAIRLTYLYNHVLLKTKKYLVMAGDVIVNSQTHILLMRIQIDPPGNGLDAVITDFDGGTGGARAMALQGPSPFPWIVVAGTRTGANYQTDMALARFALNGERDMNFGSGGTAAVDFGMGVSSDDTASALIAQPDGKLVVAGTTVGPGFDGVHHSFALARFKADGSALDTSWGSAGKVTTGYFMGIPLTPFQGDADARAMLLDPSGRMVVAGFQQDSNSLNGPDFAVARYLP
jgi:uncharacterized delta-60 repeat protein